MTCGCLTLLPKWRLPWTALVHVSFLGNAILPKEIEAEAILERCRALINQINAALSAEPFVNISSAADLILSLPLLLSKKRWETKVAPKIALNYRCH
jgi:hypothetical protein